MSTYAIDFMPCTDVVDAAARNLAEQILQKSTPPGYTLMEFRPLTQKGRIPHRWICRFRRIDDIYRHSCDYLTAVRTDFKRTCPLGCQIEQVGVSKDDSLQYITIEYLVNCGCQKSQRRK